MYKIVLSLSNRRPRKGCANGTLYTVIRERDGARLTLKAFAEAVGLHQTTLIKEFSLKEFGEYDRLFRIMVRIKLDRKAGRDAGGNYEDPRPEELAFEHLQVTHDSE